MLKKSKKKLKLLVAICHSFWFISLVWRHEQTYYIVWLVDVDRTHLEVRLTELGLLVVCWDLVWIFKAKVSREIAQFSPSRTRTCLALIGPVSDCPYPTALKCGHRFTAWGGICAWAFQTASKWSNLILKKKNFLSWNRRHETNVYDKRMMQESLDPEQARRDFIARQRMGRLGTPEEIAHLVVYLAADEVSCS
jgi:hypothetical protein